MKVKLNNDQMLSLLSTLEATLNEADIFKQFLDDDVCCLVQATLEELLLKLKQMTIIRQRKYSFKMKPTWALALRAAFAGRLDITTFEGITVMRICNDIHKNWMQQFNN